MKTIRMSNFLLKTRSRVQGPALIILLAAALLLAGQYQSARAAEASRMIPASFSELAAKVSPAVVNISTVRVVKDRGGFFTYRTPRQPKRPDEFRDPFDFFDKFFGPQLPPRERRQRSLGSGFIIDPKGFIITNNHVVQNAEEIVVRLSNEKEFKAKVIGRDLKTDIALIKINTREDLPFVKLGDSSRIKIGDWVVAIGNPFGLDHTVTAGIISAKGRVIGAGPYDDFLQTDASINPGNSGGPLLNLDGEVIGINTAISAAGQGIGFAIPANLAKDIVAQLKEKGRVVRGWLGIIIQKITPELAESFKLKDRSGSLVADVDPDGPALKAGIKRGDVIIAFNGKKIEDWSDLPALVAAAPVGSEAEIIIIRDGKEKTIRVKLGELREERIARPEPVREEILGLSVQELTPELARRYQVDQNAGVIISRIAEGSPAQEAGLKPGDLILEINHQLIDSLRTYHDAIGRIKKKEIALFLVKRGPNTLFYTLQTG
ncbi:MAG: DegQ family serine endoprotease [Deltaproteobacteria bacterium]|nr:DegQ family serine endoprotease [Deltaproteobacteria bacterium]